MLHVAPAGMFEAYNLLDPWSVEMNVWRELLEEVYDMKQHQGSGTATIPDPILSEEPIVKIRELIQECSAELSVTGICCDLWNFRPEICTVLFVDDPGFSKVRSMVLNWEYVSEGPIGVFSIPFDRIGEIVVKEGEVGKGGICPSGAACIKLGYEWVRRRHRI
jgi:hypothetical protein